MVKKGEKKVQVGTVLFQIKITFFFMEIVIETKPRGQMTLTRENVHILVKFPIALLR